MPLWSIFVWLVIGAIAGYVASLITKRTGRYGLIGDIVLGLLGSIVGGWIFSLIGLGPTFGGFLGSIVVAIIGAVALIFALRAVSARV